MVHRSIRVNSLDEWLSSGSYGQVLSPTITSRTASSIMTVTGASAKKSLSTSESVCETTVVWQQKVSKLMVMRLVRAAEFPCTISAVFLPSLYWAPSPAQGDAAFIA